MNNSLAGILTLVLAVFAGRCSTVAPDDACYMPNNRPGTCVPAMQCPLFNQLFLQYGADLPPFLSDSLRRSVCSDLTTKSIPHICCEMGMQSTFSAATNRILAEDIPNERGLQILRNTKCGDAAGSKISGGTKARLFEFPWMAVLRYSDGSNRCGGSLISDQFILTAAHCITSHLEVVSVRLGEHEIGAKENCQVWGKRKICSAPAEEFLVEKVIKHAGFNNKKKINDVALIKLKRKVQFKKHIKPICLPITPSSAELQENQKYNIAGWGTTEYGPSSSVLLKAMVPHKDLQVCQNLFKHRITLTKNHICAGGEGNIDTCKGDSGGPLFAQARYELVPRFIQYGVVSNGINCGGSITYPGIYASVVDLLPWITTKIAENS